MATPTRVFAGNCDSDPTVVPRGRKRAAKRLFFGSAATLVLLAWTLPVTNSLAQRAGGSVTTAAQVFQQMLVEEQEQRAREAKERAEESPELTRHRNRHGGSRPPPLLRDVPVEDWLATEEGRFAHSIRIPNPVPEDSGYRPGMTQQEYFEHLCKNEAGEFIFKTADNVDGLYQIRPRRIYTDQEWRHLYALEDPYGYWKGEHEGLGQPFSLVKPRLYSFLELPAKARVGVIGGFLFLVDASLLKEPTTDATVGRYTGYDGRDTKAMRLEYDTKPRARYGFTWRGVKRPMDRELGIAGGELIVLDLQTNEVMGVRRGYNAWNRGWTGRMCPRYGYLGGQDKGAEFTAWFVAKVARPAKWSEYFADHEKYRMKPR